MRLRPHPGGVRGKAPGAHRADERRAEDPPVPDAGPHPAGAAHQEAASDLGVHAALPRGDQLQRHRQGGQRDPAHGGETLWDDTENDIGEGRKKLERV